MRKAILILLISLSGKLFAQETARITITDTGHTVISRDIYGLFSEHLGRGIYDGIYYKGHIRQDIVQALKEIHLPNLRWPGGCFADQYHWRDGIGEPSKRPKTVNTTWGMVTEDNSFGTEEFMELCKEIGCEPYIAGNVGTGSPQEMKDWVTYLNYDHHDNVSLWGVGNESWGCGGNMAPEYYANLYNHFASFLPDYPGTHLKKIISGPNGDDYHWMETMLRDIGPDNNAWGVSLHYYTVPSGHWHPKGSASEFNEQAYAHTLVEAEKLDTIIQHHERIMDRYDPKKQLALAVDEWGVWTDPEPGTPARWLYQQGSLRDALVAATTLNLFNNHAGRVRLADLAQTVNVLQSLILTRGDKMIKTPTYWVFDLFKLHQNAKLLPIQIESPWYVCGKDSVKAINASASVDQNGICLTLVNLDAKNSITVTATLPQAGTQISGRIMHHERFNAINTFEVPERVKPEIFEDAKVNGKQINVTLPPLSVVALEVR